MNAKRNLTPYAYILLGCLGIIASLTIYTPSINRYRHDIDVLSQAIKVNLTNHDDELAEYNTHFLESRTNYLKSTKWKMGISITLYFIIFVLPGIIMIITHQKQTQVGIETE